MPKPLIGLTTTRMPNPDGRPTFAVNEPYVRAVSAAGGLPVLIPLTLSDDDLVGLLPRLDGILFTGGYDVDPRRYGSQPHPKVEKIDADRDRVELRLAQGVVEGGKPFLGICRGFQVLNVALGGSLYEHILDQLPGAIQHDRHGDPRDFLSHSVSVEADSRLADILSGSQVQVNSLHHQGVRKLAPTLSPTAYATDGLIEAFELPGHPFGLAVQWHPEELQAHASMRSLFQAFVRSAARHED
jgi:putative glutamine amidotransferase